MASAFIYVGAAMRIPTCIRIIGLGYQIEWVKGLLANEGDRGNVSYNDAKIRIDPDIPFDRQQRTFLHETIHAIDETLKIGLKHDQVAQLAAGLTDVLRQIEEET